MQKSIIHSLELEKYLLAGLLRHPEAFSDIDGTVDENDFVNNLHKTIFGIIRQTLRAGEKVEKVLIAQKINILNLSFEDKVSDILGYLTDLSLIQINSNAIEDIASELKLYTLRRERGETGLRLYDAMAKMGSETDHNKIVSICDAIYNDKISLWSNVNNDVEDVCGDLSDLLYRKGLTPGIEIGLRGPHNMLHNMYGSILRPSNISVICARAKAGKTTFLTDFTYRASKMNGNIPILHIDMGEMSKEELQLRLAANLSGVPLGYIEDGTYIRDKGMTAAIESIKEEIKDRRFFYLNAAGRSVEDIISSIRRWYLSKVGRGNMAIVCLDYLKAHSDFNSANKAEWERMGLLITKLKDFLSSEVKLPLLTAVQGNRSGIIGNKNSSEIVEDESIISGGDRVTMYSSHVFIFRKKTQDEYKDEGGKYGTHILKPLVTRHLGKDVKRALSRVQVGDRYRENYLNFIVENFRVGELGDFRQQAEAFQKMSIRQKPQDVSI